MPPVRASALIGGIAKFRLPGTTWKARAGSNLKVPLEGVSGKVSSVDSS